MTDPVVPSLVNSYCPRCDRPFTATTKNDANNLVIEHIKIQIDDLHDGALEEMCDD